MTREGVKDRADQVSTYRVSRFQACCFYTPSSRPPDILYLLVRSGPMAPSAPRASTAIPVAPRISGFVYAIRNIVAEARKVEAAGRKVRYLNIGDPITFGFRTPPHLIEAVERAMRDGDNGYAPSVGILPAREAVAAECSRRGMPVSPDRVVMTSGTSEGIELALTTLAGPGDEVLIPVPTYPLYTAVLAKIGARPAFYRTDPDRGWLPDLDHLRTLVNETTRALVVIDPNNPTGATYTNDVRRALVEIADRHNIPLLADEVYADLAFAGPCRQSRASTCGCASACGAQHKNQSVTRRPRDSRAGTPRRWPPTP